MSASIRPQPLQLTTPIVWSVVLHASVIAAALFASQVERAPLPPVYRVDLVAAPAGLRAVGQVNNSALTPAAKDAPVPKRAESAPADPMPTTRTPPNARQAPAAATPVPNAVSAKRNAAAPAAGGGPTGSTGADVVTVNTPGIVFPYQGYLDNIVRQLYLQFKPDDNRPLKCEVAFQIHRDGSVTAFEYRKKSGSYSFDSEARAVVEVVGRSRAFGPLPAGFSDDVLPVIFTFDQIVTR